MPTITPEELRSQHPRRFRKEYEAWQEHAIYDDWADWIKEDYESQMRVYGIKVDRFVWSISYSQGDGAAFDGHVSLYAWMEANPQYIERYPALYLACKQDGSYVKIRTSRGMYLHANINESLWGTDPEGIFKNLEKEAWDELVSDQYDAASLEDEIKSTCERFMSDMYRTLRDEYENITSEDAFVESCDANGVTFELEGEEDCEVST